MATKIIVLQEDECAPDALEYFQINFELMFNISFKEWLKKAEYKDIDDGYGSEYTLGDIEVSYYADAPYWVIYKLNTNG